MIDPPNADDGTHFVTALDHAAEESLDDRAHYRPDRHWRPPHLCGFLRQFEEPETEQKPPVPRTYPEDGCPRACTECGTRFKFGEFIHPDIDGTRCIPCFKAHWRNMGRNLANVFRAAVTPATDDERAAQDRAMQRHVEMLASIYRAGDLHELATLVRARLPVGTMTDREIELRATIAAWEPDVDAAVAAQIAREDADAAAQREAAEAWQSWKPDPFLVRRAARALRDFDEEVMANMPQGVSAAGIALDELRKGIEEQAVGRCHKCGSPTANADRLGAACATDMLKEPEERCRGYIHPLDDERRAVDFFHGGPTP